MFTVQKFVTETPCAKHYCYLDAIPMRHCHIVDWTILSLCKG